MRTNGTSALRIGLYCDREDWILGTIAQQIKLVHGNTGQFEFAVNSWQRFMESPLLQIRSFNRCDIIHWIMPHGCFEFGDLFPKVRHICTIHHCLSGDSLWPTAFEGMQVLTVSQLSRQALEARGFRSVPVVHYGVDGTLFQPLSRARCRQLLNIETSRPLIGFFGKASSNPQDRKGTQMLVTIAGMLAATRAVGVLVSGEGWDGLARQLESVGVEVFRRQDTVDKMPIHYGAIDVYLCTSRIEGGPVPVLEAMACERPVVSTPVGHVPEVIRDGENGLVVPKDDVQAAARAVERVLSDPTLAHRLAQAGRATVLEQWTWEKVLGPLAEIYFQVARTGTTKGQHVLKFAISGSKLLARSWRNRFSGLRSDGQVQ